MSEEIKTWRDLITLGAKAAGVDMSDRQFADLMQNEAFATPLRGAFINDLEDLTFKLGKDHSGLQRHFQQEIGGRAHGTFAGMSERAFRQKAKEYGFETDMLDKLIEDTKGSDFMPRWEGIADFFYKGGLSQGEKAAKNDRGDDALKLENKQLQSQLEAFKKDFEADRKEWETRVNEERKAREDLKIKHALDRQVRAQIKFNSDYPPSMVNSFIENQLGAITSKYNIINKNGDFIPFSKDDPTNVATDPETGRALTLSDVLAAHFPEDVRQKQPEGGGNGHQGRTPITGGGEKGDPRFAHLHKFADSMTLPKGK